MVRAGARPRRTARGGLAALRADRLVWPLALGLLALVLTLQVINVADVFLVRDSLHAGVGGYGAVGAVLAAAMVVGAVVGGRIQGSGRQARAVIWSAAVIVKPVSFW